MNLDLETREAAVDTERERAREGVREGASRVSRVLGVSVYYIVKCTPFWCLENQFMTEQFVESISRINRMYAYKRGGWG